MVPSGPPNPVRGVQPSLLRTNSAILGGSAQPGSMPSQPPFPSLVSPRTQFNSNGNGGVGLLGNISNVSSLLNNSFAFPGSNGGGGISSPPVNLQQRGSLGGAVDMVGSAEPDPLAFPSSSGLSQGQQHFQNPLGSQHGSDHPQPQQLDAVQSFQQQFSSPSHGQQQQIQQQQQQQQQQLRGGLANLGNMGPVKLEPQMGPSGQNGPPQLQSMRGGGGGVIKMEHQQMSAPLGSMGTVKLERQHSDPSMFLQQQQIQQQQQQQQQQMMLSRQQQQQQQQQQMNLIQQQRLLQMQQQQQQQQQQQILKTLPQQRGQLQQQILQQNLPARPPLKPAMYEPGMCAKRLTHYMFHQKHRPEDNNIEFWRKFVAEYFAPNAKKRWCVSLYGSGRQTTGVFPQDVWHCEICNHKPGRGFETTVEVLPRLNQIKYASGTLEELLYVDMPREYQNKSGQIVLDYAKAVQESVFEQLRVVRDGQLRIVFNPDLKIASWEFCARRHEELIPRRLIVPQVNQLGSVIQKYHTASQTAASNVPTQDLQNTCNSFMSSARQLAKALEVPLVNDLGYTKRYVRCLQISEVVNCMKDLIDYSRETGTGPMDSLINFPRRNSGSPVIRSQAQQSDQQQQLQQQQQQSLTQSSSHNDQNSSHANNGVAGGVNSLNVVASTTTVATVSGLHQNAMNARQETHIPSVNSPYTGGNNAAQIPSAGSSTSQPPSQPNPSSPFTSPTPSTSNNNLTVPHSNAVLLSPTNSSGNISAIQRPNNTQQQQHLDSDQNDPQSSVEQILQEMMMSSHMNGVGPLGGNEVKSLNGLPPSLSNGGIAGNSPGISNMGFGGTPGLRSAVTAGGIRATMAGNAVTINRRIGMNHIASNPSAMSQQQQQQDMGNRMLGGLGSVNGLDNLQFDWKSSP